MLLALAVVVVCAAIFAGWFVFQRPMSAREYEQGAADVLVDSAALAGDFFDEMDESAPESDELSSSDLEALQDLTGHYSADMEEIRRAAQSLRPPERHEATQERVERVVDFLADDFFGLFDRAMRDAKPGESFSDVGEELELELRGAAVRATRAQTDLFSIAEELGVESDVAGIIGVTTALSGVPSDANEDGGYDTY